MTFHSGSAEEELFNHFLENSPIYVFFKDDQIRAIKLSRNYEKMLGKPLQELLGKTMDELFPSDLAKSMVADDLRILKEGKSVTFVEEFNGHVYSTTKFPIRIKGKSYLSGFTIDITEQKRAEETRQESEIKFKSIIETSQEWIWAIDKDARHTYSNFTVEKILGYKPSELIGKEAFQLMHEDDAIQIRKSFPDFIAGRKGWTGLVVRWKHKDGSYRFLESYSTPIFDKLGNITGFWGSDRDITERKKTEEALRNIQKLESLGLLAGGIAHDFNNLMSGIFGCIELAFEETKEKNVTTFLSQALNTIDRARALTQQLLVFAKGGAPIQKIQPLFPFVQETAQFALSGSNVACRFTISNDVWTCNFDKNQVGQVIDNLVINAQQAMPQGGTIEITARNVVIAEKEHPLLAGGNYVKLSVKDTGVGIPKEIIRKVFDPFFSTKSMGQGLGLATSYSIIKRHGGCIDIESEPGRGSKFTVYLPAIIESPTVLSEDVAMIHTGNGLFLVMDDKKVVRETTGKMLESFGYSVIKKENGRDAIEFFKDNHDLSGMILDLTVPGGMGGLDVITTIRKQNRDMPVFVASGYSDDLVMKNPADYGFTASISKPFKKAELSEMLSKYMKADNK